MNRFYWSEPNFLISGEKLVITQANVRLYDGDVKTLFDSGQLILSTHRLIWKDSQRIRQDLSLNLSLVVFVEEETASWTKSAKLVAHLNTEQEVDNRQRPVTSSPYNYVKFSFRSGGHSQFLKALNEVLAKKPWADPAVAFPEGKTYRAGIAGIERKIKAQNEATGANINVAFEDLNHLMKMAQEMVTLSKSITQKLKDKQGSITEDETLQFKSHLLSLGISDPVTKASYGSGSAFHVELAKELADFLLVPLMESDGVLSLTDVYCRVNRARGMELISPEDLLNACVMFEQLKLPVKLLCFDSGVRIIALQSRDERSEAFETGQLLKDKENLTAEELSIFVNTTVVLARERLIAAERFGLACRDDSVEGLRFYPNLFLDEPTD